MPWTPKEAKSHNKGINDPKTARRWSSIANSMLEKSGSDAEALRVANGVIKKEQRMKKTPFGGNAKIEAGEKSIGFGQHATQKKGKTKGTVVKMASGGHVRGDGCATKGHTKGRMV